MVDIIIHDMTIDEFAEYDHDGIGYLIGTGRVDVIDEQSTVDAEPVRHGHWVAEISDEEEYKCSECGDKEYYTCNYCPNCGARMDSPCSNCQEFDCYGCEAKMDEVEDG